ncbi:PREDICTED: ubiquitin-conjugating enzyme E2 32-like [Prunus mume]|uniref:Ubiquitin-conjugating enzyme E2 32-like n=1 Tax=Prunus mume TaxID=102107 RepID=A0ABM0PDX9_PRUMU|nr:PREDICTED: ubiquitin-conjugating enzyme E2 32-like [Prunus mume]
MESYSTWKEMLDGCVEERKKTLARRIQLELEEMQSNPSDDFKCLALESNPRDLQFAIRGPNGTEFAGGIYHGQITIPEEYPNKGPILTLLTENGRFKTQTEIDYFRDFFWVPSKHKRVRDALLRLIELLPTYPDGALGSVEYDKEERRVLAIKSRLAAPIYGTDERQKLINEIHKYMLSKTPPVPSNEGGDIRVSFQNDRDRRKQGIVTIKGKRKQGINLFVGNTINADECKRVGFFDFEKRHSCLWSWFF